MSRNLYIHGLRGFLALSLFFYHVVQSKLPNFENTFASSLSYIANSMEFGVELFFGISGIVIIFAFQKNKSPTRFILDRAIRIFPVLWLTIAIIICLSKFDTRRSIPLDALNIIYNLLALNVLVPTKLVHPSAWSIGYEFTFYIILVVFSLCLKKLPRIIAIGFAVTAACSLIFYNIRAIPFPIGVGIALYALKNKKINNRDYFYGISGVFIFASLIFWHLAYDLMPSRNGVDFLRNPEALLFYLMATMSATLGLYGVYQGKGLFARIMKAKVFQWLGTISFSLYLWQTIVMALIKATMIKVGLPSIVGGWSQVIFAMLALPPTLIVSHFSQIYIEGRFSSWLHNKTAPTGHPSLTATAPTRS